MNTTNILLLAEALVRQDTVASSQVELASSLNACLNDALRKGGNSTKPLKGLGILLRRNAQMQTLPWAQVHRAAEQWLAEALVPSTARLPLAQAVVDLAEVAKLRASGEHQ